MPAFRRQRQADFGFEVSLVYRMSSRTVKSYTEKSCLVKQKQKQTNKKIRL